MYIILVAGALTIVGIAALSWMSPLIMDSLGINPVALYVTGVQFDNDYLSITVETSAPEQQQLTQSSLTRLPRFTKFQCMNQFRKVR